MKLICAVVLFALTADVASAQLTVGQKAADFQAVAGLYAKLYAPYEWKRDVLGFDLLNVAPWLERIIATKDDLDFYEIVSEYVSRLNDAHDTYLLPSNFVATLNFSVDLYDGNRLLVDSINRGRLPAVQFPFATGYQLVSIDGQDATILLQSFLRYEIAANPRTTARFAATLLTTRPQQLMPHATSLSGNATVIFRRPDSRLETYQIPWTTSGIPLTTVGTYVTPGITGAQILAEAYQMPWTTSGIPLRTVGTDVTPGITGAQVLADSSEEIPAYLGPLIRLQNCRIPHRAVLNFGSLTPVFLASLPPSFVRRLGGGPADAFFSGVFEAAGLRIGFIRIPSYSPANSAVALAAFQGEMAYFQGNTDGLVIDTMRNPGGQLSYVNQLLSLVMPTQWRAMGFEVRATSSWVASISSALEAAKAAGAPQNILDLYETIKSAIVDANARLRGRTEPIPLDDVVLERPPARTSQGNLLAYTKPLIVLIDELSASAAEVFAAGIRDNARGPLVGWRTMGAGGSVTAWTAGSYSLGVTTVTQSLMNRGEKVLPPYVENIGVFPTWPVDYMTSANLSQSGKPFVDAFVASIVNHILQGR